MISVSDFLYFEKMHLYREPKGLSGALVIVDRDYRCFFRLDGKDTLFTVPAGTHSNGGSIPKVVPRWIVDNLGPFFEAYVIHDHLCREFGNKAERPWTSQVAHDVLYEAMKVTGRDPARREMVYKAVVAFGPKWG